MTPERLIEWLPDAARAAILDVRKGDVDAVTRAARGLGFAAFTLDTTGVAGERVLHDKVAEILGSPGWYGRNWDALLDCVSDLSWVPARGYVVVLEGLASLHAASPRTLETFLEVLADAGERWRSAGVPFWVLVVDDGGARQ